MTRAWLKLIALSAASTVIAATVERRGNASATIVVVAILALAGWKARIILRDYLELAGAPQWMRGFTVALTVFLLAGIALRLAG